MYIMHPIPEPTSFRGCSLAMWFPHQPHVALEFTNYTASFPFLSNTVLICVVRGERCMTGQITVKITPDI